MVDGIGYFAAEDAVHGMELWRTDGTPEGTRMVTDINPEWPSSGPKQFMAGETLVYFTATGPYGQRLFRSDGTAAGTFPVRDELPRGPANELSRALLGVVGDQLYFAAAANGDYDFELWTTDGTRAGTRQVKNLTAAGAGVMFPEQAPGGGAALGNRFFYSANNGVEGYHLWETDGTSAGTRQVKNLVPPGKLGGLTGDWVNGYPQNFLASETLVYFTATSPVDGREWWRTDGTPEGTYMLPQFAPERPAHDEAGFSSISEANHAITLGNTLFYSVRRFDSQGLNYTAIPGVAVSDGTASGTRLLRDKLEIRFRLTKEADKVWFIARDWNAVSDPEHHYGLWAATAEECHFVASVKAESRLVSAGGKLYCTNPAGGLMTVDAATEVVLGGGVWDAGEEEWTVPSPFFELDDYTEGYIGLTHAAALGSRVFFSIFTAENGGEPWITDGTTAGTKMLRDIYQHPTSSSEMFTTPANAMFLGSQNTIYFPARTEPGSLLYHLARYSTGSAPETVPGYIPSNLNGTAWGVELDDVIICALNPTSDGETQPSQLCVILGDSISSLIPETDAGHLNNPSGFTRLGDDVFFFANSAAGELSLWRTAGTAATTVKVKTWRDFEGRYWSIPGAIVVSGERIYFPVFYTSSIELSENNYELISSDGTPEGTYSFATIPTTYSPIGGGSAMITLLPLGNGVLFNHSIGYGYNDGTREGTGFFNLFDDVAITSLVSVRGKIWYTISGNGLWCTDGTVNGTRHVSSTASYIRDGFEFKGMVCLFAGDKILTIDPDTAVIQSDFTIDPDKFGGIFRTAVTEDFIYFTLSDDAHGIELWRTDASLESITLVQDIGPGLRSSDVANLRQIGTNIFFTAEDHRGREPWIMPSSLSAPCEVFHPGDRSVIVGNAFHFVPALVSGSAERWRWWNLPPGLSYDCKTGIITGIPQMSGTFKVTAEAANSGGTDVMSFTLRVVDPDYARISLTPATGIPGKLSLSLSAIAGLRYQIFTSTDLVEWEPVTLDADADFVIPELDTEAEQRFFKVLTLELRIKP
ncbi:MAG TPA: ELWxxDGT repeat protein [Verrucomicrobiae bacterium]